MRINSDLDKKYNGWYPTFRGKFLLLKNKVLSKEEFILFEASFAFADWDQRHKTFGLLLLTQAETEHLLGFSTGYVSRSAKGLFSKGFWNKLPDNSIQIGGFDLIGIKKVKEIVQTHQVVDLQKYLAETQQPFAKKREQDAKGDADVPLQNVANLQTRNHKYLVSFKDKYFIPRNNEDYQRMCEENNYQGLNPEDMKLVDETIFETMGINPK